MLEDMCQLMNSIESSSSGHNLVPSNLVWDAFFMCKTLLSHLDKEPLQTYVGYEVLHQLRTIMCLNLYILTNSITRSLPFSIQMSMSPD